jgi:hypothetical protein
LIEVAKAIQDEFARYRLYLPALVISGGAKAVQTLYKILGPEPDELTLSYVRAELAPDTATRARDVWARLADDPSPAWRRAAAAILVMRRTRKTQRLSHCWPRRGQGRKRLY